MKHIIITGRNHYIGFVNESTILKYPHFKTVIYRVCSPRENVEDAVKQPEVRRRKGPTHEERQTGITI